MRRVTLAVCAVVVAAVGAFRTTGRADHICIWERGDANLSGSVNLTDIVFLNNYLFSGGPAPQCVDAADADSSGGINISDPIYLANYLFNGGPAPAPFLVNCPGTCGAN